MILSISAYMMILKLRLLRCRFCPVFLLRMLTDHSFLYLYLLFLTAESSVTVNKRILPAFRFRYRQMFFSDTGRYFEIVFVISCSIQLNVSGVHCVCSSSIICISRSLYTRTEITDSLHKTFGFRTDYEFIKKSTMLNIIKQTKEINLP